MTPEEFKANRKKLGLTQAQLAHIFKLNITTVQRFETPSEKKSGTKINPTAERVMEWLLAGYRPPEWPQS